MAVDGSKIQSTLLQVVDEQHRGTDGGSFQQGTILREAAKRLGGRLSDEDGQALLTAWYALFRSGHLAWGFNLNNPDPPFCHVTTQGRRTLQHLSRDPSNPDGYVAHLASRVELNPIARVYVDEALRTYNANCFRATAVMVGAAAESIALDVRDAVVAGISRTNRFRRRCMRHCSSFRNSRE